MQRIQRTQIFETSRRQALLVKIERLTELPLLLLAFFTIPLLVGPFFWDLSVAQIATFASLNTFIWAVFASVLAAKMMVAPHKVAFLKTNWIEVLIVLAPFLRPLRLITVLLYGSRAFVGARRLVNLDFLLVYGIGLVIIGATLVTTVEVGVEGANIGSFPDALWWSVVTVTTVGYGDRFPVTIAGRAIAFVMMIGGIGLFSGLTANLASFFIKSEDPTKDELHRLLTEIERLNSQISQLNQNSPG